MDTNTAFTLATQWLALLSMDVRALEQECVRHVEAPRPGLSNRGEKFTPLYAVYCTKGIPRDFPMRFAVNHPFIFMIRHKRTGGIIFMERVTNPLIGSLQG
jgi:hypothetical protein